jgi:histidyl-tRNA synthetase
MGAGLALILGETEAANGTIGLKLLRDETSAQQVIPQTELISHLQHYL